MKKLKEYPNTTDKVGGNSPFFYTQMLKRQSRVLGFTEVHEDPPSYHRTPNR